MWDVSSLDLAVLAAVWENRMMACHAADRLLAWWKEKVEEWLGKDLT